MKKRHYSPRRPSAQAIRMELRGFVTVVAAAKIAGVHRSTIYSWLEQNKIENSRLGGARYILRTSLEQFLGPLLASA